MNQIDELANLLTQLPGIGPRQAKRFVYYLLAISEHDRQNLAEHIKKLGNNVHQCAHCMRFFNGTKSPLCNYCSDTSRTEGELLLVEKDQDLQALERAGTYRGRYFVLGGVLTLSGKGAIREKALLQTVERQRKAGLAEIILALSATSEGENTADHIRELLKPYRDTVRISVLGRGLATGSELEYSDAETLRAALTNRKET